MNILRPNAMNSLKAFKLFRAKNIVDMEYKKRLFCIVDRNLPYEVKISLGGEDKRIYIRCPDEITAIIMAGEYISVPYYEYEKTVSYKYFYDIVKERADLYVYLEYYYRDLFKTFL